MESGSRGTSRPPWSEEKMAAVSEAPAYWGPSVNRSWMSLDLKKRFCLGSRSTCDRIQSEQLQGTSSLSCNRCRQLSVCLIP